MAVVGAVIAACGGADYQIDDGGPDGYASDSGAPETLTGDSGCAAGQTDCAGKCVDLNTDDGHCGTCGFACDPNLVCVNGNCADHCPSPTNKCPGKNGPVCVELDNDPRNCGACNNVCPSAPHAKPACSSSMCGIACDAGFLDCDGNAANGCEVDGLTDVHNCGGCGNACPPYNNASSTCSNGQCAMGACDPGFAHCDGNPQDGCEVDTQTDTKNCGGCGKACTVAGQVCTSGTCSCPMGGAICNNTCTDTQTDDKNCGVCGHACTAAGQSCVNGNCACPNNEAICNNACTDTQTDDNNCGVCGRACTAAGQSCVNGNCACPNTEVICNNACTDTTTDSSNCGQCGNKCTVMGEVCMSSMCACPNNAPNICNNACVDEQTDPKNCGSCGNVCGADGGQMTCSGGMCTLCDATTDVTYNGHCYYLDGSGGQCDSGYALASQSVLTNISSMFSGKTYKHTVSMNCCIFNLDPTENWGMVHHCNTAGPFDSSEPVLGGAGCTNVMNNYPQQLTLCGTP